jgi:hypothetical protein
LIKIPAAAIGAEKTEIVDMEIAIDMGLPDLFGIYLVQPLLLGK